VTAGQDGRVFVWNVSDRQLVGHQPWQHRDWVYYASFSPDNRSVATASFDRIARVCDTVSGRQTDFRHNAPVRSAEFSPDGHFLVTACWDSTTRIWNVVSGEQAIPPLKHTGSAMHASFSPDGRFVLTVDTHGVTCLWDLSLCSWFPEARRAIPCESGNALVGIRSNAVEVLDPTGKVVFAESQPAEPLHAVLSPNGRKLLIISKSSADASAPAPSWQVWDVVNHRTIGPGGRFPVEGKNPCLSYDGSVMCYVSGTRPQMAHALQTASGQAIFDLAYQHKVEQFAFDQQERQFAIVSANDLHVWDVPRHAMRLKLAMAHHVSHAEFNPDGSRIAASCSDGSLSPRYAQIWETATGRPVTPRLDHNDGVRYISFSHDGKRVVTAGEDRQALIWSADTGARLGSSLRHPNEVSQARFSPDDRFIVTACRDRFARVWNPATGEPITPPLKQLEYMEWAQFLADGQQVVTVTPAGQSRIWRLLEERSPIEDLLLTARLLSGRQTDPTGAWPLTAQSLRDHWARLGGRTLSPQAAPPDDAEAWHRRQLAASEQDRHWFSAVFHLEELIKLRPNDDALQQRREDARRELARFNLTVP
jgi:WD40 repeat protein